MSLAAPLDAPTATAVIGTGIMGREMARRLLAAGHELRVYNRTAARAVLIQTVISCDN